MREIKFRAWDKKAKKMYKVQKGLYGAAGEGLFQVTGIHFGKDWECDVSTMNICLDECGQNTPHCEIMQFTGLKDKKGLTEIYEGDIIDVYGNIKGNIYESQTSNTDLVIQGFGDKNWGATYQEAVDRGCQDTQRYASEDDVRKLD